MKKQLLFLAISFLTCSMTMAQTNVKVEISHKLGSEFFAFGTVVSNDLNQSFKTARCEYYLSGFTLVHDGGQELSIDDVYALVQADEVFEIDLGTHNVTTVEALRFHTGVDEASNHLDPTLYPMDHPLAPKSPSMHWGWVSGYRFLAFEGKSGPNTDKELQIHSLGNKHYHEVTLPMNMSANGGALILPVEADVQRILDGIDIADGMVEHSDKDAAATAMQNMRDHVFSSASTTSADAASAVQSFQVFPNPNHTGQATIALDLAHADAGFQIRVTDVFGKQLFLSEMQRNSATEIVEVPSSGVYVVSVLKNGKAVLNKKLVVQL